VLTHQASACVLAHGGACAPGGFEQAKTGLKGAGHEWPVKMNSIISY